MKIEQLKMNVEGAINEVINKLYPPTNLTNRMVGATARSVFKQKKYMLFDALDMFADKNGEVDIEGILIEYENALMPNGRLELNLKEITQDLGLNLPDAIVGKTIVLDKTDIKRILGIN